MHKQTRAREFDRKAREEIYTRDGGECIFCMQKYRMEGSTWLGREIKSVMHYIPRSQGGLGIPQNGAVGCQWHHEMMDNGNGGHRVEMRNMFREYLEDHYVDWNEGQLTYNKWSRRQ